PGAVDIENVEAGDQRQDSGKVDEGEAAEELRRHLAVGRLVRQHADTDGGKHRADKPRDRQRFLHRSVLSLRRHDPDQVQRVFLSPKRAPLGTVFNVCAAAGLSMWGGGKRWLSIHGTECPLTRAMAKDWMPACACMSGGQQQAR